MKSKLIEVKNTVTEQNFLDVAREIYKDDKIWVCPLDVEINGILDASKNNFFEHGKASRWYLVDENNKYIGRIAAFINYHKVNKWNQPTGGIGFFESINNQKVANKLFDIAKEWLLKQDIHAMDGPINFGENLNHWGLLVDGFTHQGYGMQYHLPYYQQLFTSYGFEVFFKQYSFHIDIKVPFPERFWKIAERVVNRPAIKCEHFSFANKNKYINDLIEIYNETWQTVKDDATPVTFNDIDAMLGEQDIIEEKFIWFVYYNDEPAAFFVMLPDVNQIIKHLNGKLNFINKMKFAYYKWRKTITRTRVLVMGVKPKYQRLGLESAIFWQTKKVLEKMPHYTEIELSWVGDYNPKMIKLFKATGAKHVKTHITFRYLFNRDAEFNRLPIPDIR